MCTAISYKTRNHYFGRNLDMDCSFGEDIVIFPLPTVTLTAPKKALPLSARQLFATVCPFFMTPPMKGDSLWQG